MKKFSVFLLMAACSQILYLGDIKGIEKILIGNYAFGYKISSEEPGSAKPQVSYETLDIDKDEIAFELWYKNDTSKYKPLKQNSRLFVRIGTDASGWNDQWIVLLVGDRLIVNKPITRLAFAVNKRPTNAHEIKEYRFPLNRKTFIQAIIQDGNLELTPQTGGKIAHALGRVFPQIRRLAQKTVTGLPISSEVSTQHEDIVPISIYHIDPELYPKKEKEPLTKGQEAEREWQRTTAELLLKPEIAMPIRSQENQERRERLKRTYEQIAFAREEFQDLLKEHYAQETPVVQEIAPKKEYVLKEYVFKDIAKPIEIIFDEYAAQNDWTEKISSTGDLQRILFSNDRKYKIVENLQKRDETIKLYRVKASELLKEFYPDSLATFSPDSVYVFVQKQDGSIEQFDLALLKGEEKMKKSVAEEEKNIFKRYIQQVSEQFKK